MFTDMFNEQLDKLKPTAESIACELRDYGNHSIELLRQIRDAVAVDDQMYWRHRPVVMATVAGGIIANTAALRVRAGEQWVLESVTLVPQGAVGTPGSITLGIGPGIPMWGGAHTGRPTTLGGNGVRIESGTQLAVTANEVDCQAYFQFRIERNPPRKDATYSPVETGSDGQTDPPNPEVYRHAPMFTTGEPTVK